MALCKKIRIGDKNHSRIHYYNNSISTTKRTSIERAGEGNTHTQKKNSLAECTRLINIHFVPEFHFFLCELFDWTKIVFAFDCSEMVVMVMVAFHKQTLIRLCMVWPIINVRHHTMFMSIDYYLTFFSVFSALISISTQSRIAPATRMADFWDWQIWNMKVVGRIDKIKVKCRKSLSVWVRVRIVSSDWFLWYSRVHFICFIHC